MTLIVYRQNGLQDFFDQCQVSLDIDFPSAYGESARRLALPLRTGNINLSRSIDTLYQFCIRRLVFGSKDHNDMSVLECSVERGSGYFFADLRLKSLGKQVVPLTALDELGNRSS